MNRRSSQQLVRAAAGIAAVVLSSIALSGCLATPSDGDETASSPATSQVPSPTPTWTEVRMEDESDLTFAQGASLESGTVTQWADGLVDESDWRMTSPDDGQGGWAYSTADGACVASFWQGAVHDMTAKDDRAASDFVLAAVLRAEPADLQGKVGDGTFSHRSSGEGSVDQRFVQGTLADGTPWILAARGFAQTRSAVYVDVKCTSGDVSQAAAFVWKNNAVRAG